MEARFLRDVIAYDLLFEAGKVYDLDEGVYQRFMRDGSIEKAVKVKQAVEQPEAPVAFKPVATVIEPLPDLAKEPKPKKK